MDLLKARRSNIQTNTFNRRKNEREIDSLRTVTQRRKTKLRRRTHTHTQLVWWLVYVHSNGGMIITDDAPLCCCHTVFHYPYALKGLIILINYIVIKTFFYVPSSSAFPTTFPIFTDSRAFSNHVQINKHIFYTQTTIFKKKIHTTNNAYR